MRPYRVLAPLALAGALVAFVTAARAAVFITVDKSSQQMWVNVDGELRWIWPVSTGLARYDTPNGYYTTFRMAKEHYSREWDYAPMPHSIFFTRIGHAIHGTSQVQRLGHPASHGCVRLAPQNAAQLFALVRKHGLHNTTVTVTGSLPRAAPLVAENVPDGMPVAAARPPLARVAELAERDLARRAVREMARQDAERERAYQIALERARLRAEQEKAQRAAEELARRVAQEEAEQAAQNLARQHAEETKARRAAEELARQRAEEERIRQAQQEARIRAEHAEAQRAAEEQAQRAVAEQARLRAEKERAQGVAEQQARLRAQQERAARAAREQARKRAARAYPAPAPAYQPPRAYAAPRVQRWSRDRRLPSVYYDPRVEVIEEVLVNGTWVRRRYYRQAHQSDHYWRR